MSKKIKICFHVPDAYSLFDTKTNFLFGGAELRASIFAKHLAQYTDMDVSFITYDHGQVPSQTIDGVKVLSDRYFPSENKVPSSLLNLISNKIFNLRIKISHLVNNKMKFPDHLKYYWLEKMQADFYCIFSMTHSDREVINYCIQNKKKYLLFLASDEQLNLENNRFNLSPETIKNSVANAYKIFTQNKFQKDKISSLFNREGITINSPIEINKNAAPLKKEDKLILWVGKANDIKRPMIFIELAKQHPEKKFAMVCNNDDTLMLEEVKKNIPSNVKFYGSLSLQETEKLFTHSTIFISTSRLEGFPNTFLQAGNYRLPVISLTVNPNNYISDYNCGFVCNDSVTEITNSLEKLYTNDSLYKSMAENHFNYVCQNHDVKKVVNLLYQQIAA